MGSSQSSGISATASNVGQNTSNPSSIEDPITTTTTSTSDTMKKKRRSPPQPPEDLNGPQLVEWKCRKKKKLWSECVGSYYGRFSRGKVLEDETPDCDELFEGYRQCYLRGMLSERQRKGLQPPPEGTFLAEFVEEEGINLQQQPKQKQ